MLEVGERPDLQIVEHRYHMPTIQLKLCVIPAVAPNRRSLAPTSHLLSQSHDCLLMVRTSPHCVKGLVFGHLSYLSLNRLWLINLLDCQRKRKAELVGQLLIGPATVDLSQLAHYRVVIVKSLTLGHAKLNSGHRFFCLNDAALFLAQDLMK